MVLLHREAAEEIKNLRKDLLANAKDAERYRFIKSSKRFCPAKWNPFSEEWCYVPEHVLDEGIKQEDNQ